MTQPTCRMSTPLYRARLTLTVDIDPEVWAFHFGKQEPTAQQVLDRMNDELKPIGVEVRST